VAAPAVTQEALIAGDSVTIVAQWVERVRSWGWSPNLHSTLPSCIFRQPSDAVNTSESMIPATVKVPPMIAHIYLPMRDKAMTKKKQDISP